MNCATTSTTAFDRETTLDLIEFSQDLPSLPERFVRIQEIIRNPRSNADDLAEVIRTDQATSAMILKFANSPAYNPTATPVASLPQAIARLGSRETANVASAMSLMYGMILPTGMNNIRMFWGHAFAVAIVSEHISRMLNPADPGPGHQTAYMTGLLHDIGRAILGMRVDLAYFERETGHLHGEDLIAAERTCYGIDHAEAGMHLLRQWRFPETLYLAVGEHHAENPSHLPGRICRTANRYVREHMPAHTAFDNIPEFLKQKLAEVPPEHSPGDL